MIEFTEALGVDFGEKRVGIARVGSIAKLPEPIATLQNSDNIYDEIKQLVQEFNSDIIIVGLPRNLSGEDTSQTLVSRRFADTLEEAGMRVKLQDEALTSKQANQLIKDGVYRRNMYGDSVTTDEVAACIILQDFIRG